MQKKKTHYMTNYPIFQLPNFARPFTVQVDASDRGLGAIFCEMDE